MNKHVGGLVVGRKQVGLLNHAGVVERQVNGACGGGCQIGPRPARVGLVAHKGACIECRRYDGIFRHPTIHAGTAP